jgi:peptidoglycan/xylan/chitin deacetylase (PgdA/CDA1 family)
VPKSPNTRRRRRWLLAMVSLLMLVGAVFLAISFRYFYRRELLPWLPPTTSLWSWRLDGLERAPQALFDFWRYRDSGHSRKKLIALTFDDGPYPLYTPLLLDILKHYKVKATFFVVGIHVREFPALARQIVADGHEIANHTNRHRRERDLTQAELRDEVLACEQAILDVTGQRPHCFRPAGGNLSDDGIQTIQNLGYTSCNATINPGDWWQRDPDKLIEWSFHGRSREGVTLMHSGALGIVRALPGYINSLRAKGFEFVTVSELAKEIGQPLPDLPKRTHIPEPSKGGPNPGLGSPIPEADDEYAP